MTRTRRVVTEFDFRRAMQLLRSARVESGSPDALLRELADELDGSVVVPSTEIPPDVVTLHSHVLLDSGEDTPRKCLLTLMRRPVSDRRLLSIIEPLGAAILGRRVGDTVAMPGAVPVHIRALLYQPEAAGEFHR